MHTARIRTVWSKLVGLHKDTSRCTCLPAQWLLQQALSSTPLVVQVANAQRGGAFAALVYNNQEDGFEKMLPDNGWSGPTITMPSALMPASSARTLLQDLMAGATLTVTFKALTLPANRWESLAYFSSVGPTLDGRFKPDIVTPGTTIASFSAE